MARLTRQAGEFRIVIDSYSLTCVPDGLPVSFNKFRREAELYEAFDPDAETLCCLVVRRIGNRRPLLVVAQSLSPAGGGFEPGLLLVPETGCLFIGAGERILAYDLGIPRRLWEDRAEFGFWEWARYGDVAVMSAELELAAWTVAAEKLWTIFVEPPWDYRVEGGMIHLDVMGKETVFPLLSGPGR